MEFINSKYTMDKNRLNAKNSAILKIALFSLVELRFR